ncbi:MAG: NAD(P)/FAD-dependent oxidoreductase [Bacillota bacterium]
MATEVLIIGGGAAGLLAAIAAAERGARTVLLERNPQPGIKILMSGGGRCNITNTGDVPHLVDSFPGNGRFLYSSFRAFGNDDILRLLAEEGVATHVEDRGRVFPDSADAHDVVRALVRRARAAGAELVTGTRVKSVERLRPDGRQEPDTAGEPAAAGQPDRPGFRVTGVRLEGRGARVREVGPALIWETDRLVITTGGVSYPSSGSTGDGYAWAEAMGHRIVPPRPAIVGLEARESWPAAVRGVALRDVTVMVRAGGKTYARSPGDVLFTHFGISGPATLNASHQAVLAEEEHPGQVELAVRLEPDSTREAWEERLRQALADHPRQLVRNVLTAWWPASLASTVMDLAGLPGDREAAHLTREERGRLAALLHEIRLTLKRPRPLAEAMVTAGGVDVREVNPRTMGSRLVPGLYFAGEVLDVDGISGGYNLQGAYSTGWLAGRSAALGER